MLLWSCVQLGKKKKRNLVTKCMRWCPQSPVFSFCQITVGYVCGEWWVGGVFSREKVSRFDISRGRPLWPLCLACFFPTLFQWESVARLISEPLCLVCIHSSACKRCGFSFNILEVWFDFCILHCWHWVTCSNVDSLDLDLHGDLSVDLNQEMTYPEVTNF